MNDNISFDYSNAMFMISDDELMKMEKRVMAARQELVDRTGKGNEWLGWLDLPIDYNKEEFERIKKAAKRIQDDSEILIVIGIGGSYLGAKAAIESLRHTFYNVIDKDMRGGTPQIFFAGHNISSTYLEHLLDVVGKKKFSINVISKSGTTTEPAIAFRLFKQRLLENCNNDPEETAKRIYVTTEVAQNKKAVKDKDGNQVPPKPSALENLAKEKGYEIFEVPEDVGGRFSVLTPVGLLPIAVSGADIDALMSGAADSRRKCINFGFQDNIALQYVACRNILLEKGRDVEILANFTPSVHYIGEWWKQLFGESEGKDGKGIFPTVVDFTTDLHSLGQYIQEGTKNHLETVINIENPRKRVVMQEEEVDIDGLNYLSGQTVNYINDQAMNGTMLAHYDGQIPNMKISIPQMNEYCLGELFYFFEFACGVSGYVLGVNPFNQPGVESYKNNMFALLEKPGYEAQYEALTVRLKK